jgi:hypothetical protein
LRREVVHLGRPGFLQHSDERELVEEVTLDERDAVCQVSDALDVLG